MRFVKIPTILSTAPDLSCVVIRKRHRKAETISLEATINNLAVFWLAHYTSVCDVSIAPRKVLTSANKLRWRSCPDKSHYKIHCNL